MPEHTQLSASDAFDERVNSTIFFSNLRIARQNAETDAGGVYDFVTDSNSARTVSEGNPDDANAIQSAFNRLTAASGVAALDRERNRKNLAILQMLAAGYSADQIFPVHEDDGIRDARIGAGNYIVRLLLENDPNTPEGAARIGGWIRQLTDALGEAVLPQIDPARPVPTARQEEQFNLLSGLGMDLSQMFQRLISRNEACRAGMTRDGEDPADAVKHWEQVSGISSILQFVSEGKSLDEIDALTDPTEKTQSLINQLARKWMLERYNGLLTSGMSIRELTKYMDGSTLYQESSALQTAAASYIAVNGTQDMQAIRNYLEDKGPLPKGLAENGLAPARSVYMEGAVSSVTFSASHAENLFRPDWSDSRVREEAAQTFDEMFGNMIHSLSPSLNVLKAEGLKIESATQLFYIDGLSVDEYLQKSNLEVTENNRKAAIVQACSRAREHVGVASYSLQNGKADLHVTEIETDLKVFKGMEGFFDKSRPRRASQLYDGDSGRQARHDRIVAGIRQNIRENNLAAASELYERRTGAWQWSSGQAMQRQTGVAEADLHPADGPRPDPEHIRPVFDAPTPEMTASAQQIYREYNNLSNQYYYGSPLRNDNMAGLRAIAALKLMEADPNVHFADIMNPTDDIRRRLNETADQVLYERFSPDYVAAGMRTLANINLREETLRALGKDPAMPPTDAAILLNKDENQQMTAAFLQGYTDFFNRAWSALRDPFADPNLNTSLQNRVNALPNGEEIVNGCIRSFHIVNDHLRDLTQSMTRQYRDPQATLQSIADSAGGAVAGTARTDAPANDMNPQARLLADSMSLSYMSGILFQYDNFAEVPKKIDEQLTNINPLIESTARDMARDLSTAQYSEMLSGTRTPDTVQDARRRMAQTGGNVNRETLRVQIGFAGLNGDGQATNQGGHAADAAQRNRQRAQQGAQQRGQQRNQQTPQQTSGPNQPEGPQPPTLGAPRNGGPAVH